MDLSVDSSVVDVIDPREAREMNQIVEQVIAKYQSNSGISAPGTGDHRHHYGFGSAGKGS